MVEYRSCVEYRSYICLVFKNKDQNSAEAQCSGFSILESRCRSFSSSEKCLGITMLCLICLCFSISWCFQRRMWFYSPNLDVIFFGGHGIAISWFFGLGIPILWFMCLYGFVFRGCPCSNWKVSTDQNRRNRWCQIVRRTI